MPHKIITPPEYLPVTLAEAKEHLRVDHDAEDALIESLISAAVQHIEDHTRRAIVTRIIDVYFDAFADEMEIPLPPLLSVESVSYIDSDGAAQTLDDTVYSVDSARSPGMVMLAYGQSWPATRCQKNAVTVRVQAGYGDSWLAVPPAMRAAILLIVGHLYENREAVVIGQAVNTLPLAVDALLAPYKVYYT